MAGAIMPPRKTVASRITNLQKGTNKLKDSQATSQLDKSVSDLHSELESANTAILNLEISLAEKTALCESLLIQLEACQKNSAWLSQDLDKFREKYQELYRELRTARQGRARGVLRNSVLAGKISELKAIDRDRFLEVKEHTRISAEATKALVKLQDQHAFITENIMESMRNLETHMQEKVRVVKQKLKESSKVITTLRKAQKSASSRQERAVRVALNKTIKEKSVHKLLHNGVYTNETRSLVRQLAHAGCSQSKVGYIITTVFQSAGVETVGEVSRRSVNCMIKEGYLAAQLQLGHEMANAESMTFSADGTSHRGINYNSRHVNFKAEDYGSGSGETKRTTRFLGVQSSADGTSEESIKDIKKILGNIVDLYKRSHLGKRTGNLARVVEILIKVTGAHGDHCPKEKKDGALLESEKRDAVNQILGEKVMLDKTNEQLYHIINAAEKQLMNDVGGVPGWIALSVEEQVEAKARMMEAIVMHLGEQAFTLLSDDEKRIMRLFIWAGCGCHKDLNTVRGGYATMKKWWEENDIDPPILLANRDNAAVLKEVEPGDDVVTPAQERAFEMTDRGGIKATQLAGAIFNHKNDKVGHHNVFRWWWEKNVGSQFTFPDTSNTRFQSHCNAAAALLLHLPQFIKFLEYIRDVKQSGTFNHMEQNLWNALHCTATKTEMAVLALYAQAITHPYMKVVCATGEKQENMLNLGPFHQKVQNHMQRIIGDPKFLLGRNASYEMGSLDGKDWNSPEIFNSIQMMSPELPHLEPLLVSFFKGASKTWKRFTSEFAPGGLIDEATVEERELAWMPATNDVNEGALGSFRVLLRRQPQLTQQGYNALSMFFRNDTEAFMKAKFTEKEDHSFLRSEAREIKGDEKKKKLEYVDHNEARAKQQAATRIKTKERREKDAEWAATITINLKRTTFADLKGPALKKQLKIFKLAGAPNLKKINTSTKVDDIRKALMDSVKLHKQGEWAPTVEIDEDTGEDFAWELEDDESDG
jgi:hypothetical protein